MRRHLKEMIYSILAAKLGRLFHRHGGHGRYGHGYGPGYGHHGYHGHYRSKGYHGHYRFKGHYRKKRRRYY